MDGRIDAHSGHRSRLRQRVLSEGFESLEPHEILEFLLYYMTKPEYQLRVREEIYLSNTLDLF